MSDNGNGSSEATETRVDLHLGEYETGVLELQAGLTRDRVPQRIVQRDHTVWSPEPAPELTDRLGWLDLPEAMRRDLDGIEQVADEVRRDGIEQVVLLGMGGSSLAPEVFTRVFGNAPGHPSLRVLDTTHPDAVRRAAMTLDLDRSLFLISSKSGTTLETLSLYRAFWARVARGSRDAGRHFIAITDPGSSLERLAVERGFRHIFRAPEDVGGRFSALSVFGMVPAVLLGLDTHAILEHALSMAGTAAAPTGDSNHGLLLGATLAALARNGRDKLTFITGTTVAPFPDWIEQLIAESTGKEGKGIVPVVAEPVQPIDRYSADRVFATLSTPQDDNQELDNLAMSLATVGHPVIQIAMHDRLALGAEMFRWEMATAVIGSVLGINPFDQPDVQLAKELAKRAMTSGGGAAGTDTSVHAEDSGALEKELDSLPVANPGDYVAVQAYVAPSPTVTELLQRIRASLAARLGVASTLGYGPRFLHSTGQLHKGGPNTGIFVQFVDTPEQDEPVPETDFTFGQLIQAQARGDYEALTQRERRVIRTHLGGNAAHGLERVLNAIG